MRLFRLAAIGAVALGAYRMLAGRAEKPRDNAAFADGQGARGNATQIRDAGPEAMRDPTDRPWTEIDEDGDASFPASDPPGNY